MIGLRHYTKGEIKKIDIPESVIADYEIIEQSKGYREWCIPAEIVNRYMRG